MQICAFSNKEPELSDFFHLHLNTASPFRLVANQAMHGRRFLGFYLYKIILGHRNPHNPMPFMASIKSQSQSLAFNIVGATSAVL